MSSYFIPNWFKAFDGFDLVTGSIVLTIIRKVSFNVTTFLGPQLIKFPKIETKVKEFISKLLETDSFPLSSGARIRATVVTEKL